MWNKSKVTLQHTFPLYIVSDFRSECIHSLHMTHLLIFYDHSSPTIFCYIHNAKGLTCCCKHSSFFDVSSRYPTSLITNLQHGFPHSDTLHNLLSKMLLNSQLNLSKTKFHMVMTEGLTVHQLNTNGLYSVESHLR